MPRLQRPRPHLSRSPRHPQWAQPGRASANAVLIMSTLFDESVLHPTRVAPVNGYEVLMADPPWHYNSRRACASKFGGGACFHYDLMCDAELLALPVSQLAAKNAVLFMWATWPRLPLALQLIEAWGFEYKTCAFDWFKVNPDGSLFFGVGYYSKSNSEPCLLATRGQILKPETNSVSMALEDWEPQAIKEPRREHSRKPDEVRRRIEQMYPTRSKLELFARRQAPGWDVFGNEVQSDVSLQAKA